MRDCDLFLAEIAALNERYKAAARYYERLIWHEENFRLTLLGQFLDVAPITVDFLLNNECNFRCSGCTFRHVRDKQQQMAGARQMATQHISLLLGKLSRAGVKAIIFNGGGEPTLHPDLVYAMRYARKSGLDVALYSNGSYRDRDLSRQLMDVRPTYIRISVNAGRELHARFHGIQTECYATVVRNIQELSHHNRRNGLVTTLGLSFLINEINANDLHTIIGALEDICRRNVIINYIAIKPEINYRNPEKQLRKDTIARIDDFVGQSREYIEATFGVRVFYNSFFAGNLSLDTTENPPCISHGWSANVDWNGDMAFCVEFAMDEDYIIGNLIDQEFENIWTGLRRKELHDRMSQNLRRCPQACRNRMKNHLLGMLRTPYYQEDVARIMEAIGAFKSSRAAPDHVNFL